MIVFVVFDFGDEYVVVKWCFWEEDFVVFVEGLGNDGIQVCDIQVDDCFMQCRYVDVVFGECVVGIVMVFFEGEMCYFVFVQGGYFVECYFEY